MEECPGKVTVSHGQAVVQSPQSSNEGIGNSRETTAGGGVGFEHHEWFADFLSDSSSIEVLLDEVDTGSVSEEHGKHLLRLMNRSACIHRD